MKELWLIANRARDRVIKSRASRLTELPRTVGRVTDLLERLVSLRRSLELSEQRGLVLAGTKLRQEVEESFRELHYQVKDGIPDFQIPSLRDVVSDLEQVETEFDSYKFDRASNSLSVETGPVELEGVYLGPFEIKLSLTPRAEPWPGNFRVIALDPHPCEKSESVTHPHVNDEILCAGDASTTIRSALNEARLCDFFMLVRSVLFTYNPNSPHVPLDDWFDSGRSCYECGGRLDEDSSCFCDFCERDFCSECITCCDNCERNLCRYGCAAVCVSCDDQFCASCMTPCKACEISSCEECLSEGLCSSCSKEAENESETVSTELS